MATKQIMRIPCLVMLGFIFLLSTCRYVKQENPTLLYNVDAGKDFDKLSIIPLSAIGSKLEYVPLETDSACLLHSISKVSLTDSFLFVSDNNRLLLFDRKGKFINQVGSQGRGPGEYNRILAFANDVKNREIYLLSDRKIHVYDFKGQFIREFNLTFPSQQMLLTENNDLILHSYNFPQASEKPPYSWYIIDRYGKTLKALPNTLKRSNGGITIIFTPLYIFSGKIHFMEFGIDTLYCYHNDTKTPHVIFHYDEVKLPPDPTIDEVPGLQGKIWISSVLESESSLYIQTWSAIPYSISNCYFDKTTLTFHRLTENSFVNDIDGGASFWPMSILNDSLLADVVDAYDLIKSYNEQVKSAKQSDQLANVIISLTETSNPVIVILYP